MPSAKDSPITLEGMIAASEAVRALPPYPEKLRMNLTTLGYCQAALDKGGVPPEGITPFSGLPVYSDPTLATGIVEIVWTDERVETIDLMVRKV